MKKMLVTAAAMMLGTSALAWAPAEKAQMDAMGTKAPLSADKAETGGLEISASTIKPEAGVSATSAKWQDPSTGSTAATSADMADVKGAVQMASMEVKSTDQIAMGGPLEEPQGYPACAPGRGDDNCIQLYERGVEGALAAWKGTDPAVAVGGPFEPATTGAKDHSGSSDHQGMDHGQPSHDTGAAVDHSGKPAAPMTSSADDGTTKPTEPIESAAGTAPGAIGGPIESQSAYPPCRPGRGDDRCIQLYERGVARRQN